MSREKILPDHGFKNNPDLIAMYKKCHSQTEAWPEIREGIRSVGILEMEIYIAGSRLFMIVETPLDFDWKTAMDKLSHLPRQAEWEIMYPNSKSVSQKVLRLKMEINGTNVLSIRITIFKSFHPGI